MIVCSFYARIHINKRYIIQNKATKKTLGFFSLIVVAARRRQGRQYRIWWQVYLKSIIRPTSKFHFAILIVKREPCNINFTSWFEYSRRNICTATTACNHYICWIRSIKCFIRTIEQEEGEENCNTSLVNKSGTPSQISFITTKNI